MMKQRSHNNIPTDQERVSSFMSTAVTVGVIGAGLIWGPRFIESATTDPSENIDYALVTCYMDTNYFSRDVTPNLYSLQMAREISGVTNPIVRDIGRGQLISFPLPLDPGQGLSFDGLEQMIESAGGHRSLEANQMLKQMAGYDNHQLSPSQAPGCADTYGPRAQQLEMIEPQMVEEDN